MRYGQSEKMEIIRIVEQSALSVKATLKELGINRSTFYGWYRRYVIDGYDGLADKKPIPKKFWNKIPEHEKEQTVKTALDFPEKSPRELAWYITDNQGYFISESSVYRIRKSYDLITSPAYIVLSAKDKFQHPTGRVNELWQTDFSYFKIIAWGWYYLSTVLDDYFRYIIAWNLSPTMSATDVQATLDMALEKTGIEQVTVKVKPRLLSDNGPCYLSKDLREYLQDRDIKHIRSAPYHPQTQGKIERYHRSIKNVITLENYYLPGDLRRAISEFVDYYNNKRYHESLENLIPADVFYGRSDEIIAKRETIKRETIQMRRYKNLENDIRKSLIDYEECLS